MSRELVTILKMNKTGPCLDKGSLAKLGFFGKLITSYRNVLFEKRFVSAIEENHQEGVLRVGSRLPGTVTGRTSSGDIG